MRNYSDYEFLLKVFNENIRILNNHFKELKKIDYYGFPNTPIESKYKNSIQNIWQLLFEITKIDKVLHDETLKMHHREINKLYGYSYKHTQLSLYITAYAIAKRLANVIWHCTDREIIYGAIDALKEVLCVLEKYDNNLKRIDESVFKVEILNEKI